MQIPKSGFIDALDFKSPQELSKYLIYLDKNTTAFNSYFQWKKHVNFLDYTVSYGFICEMCIHLHLENYYGMTRKVIDKFDIYWNKDTQCQAPNIKFDP